MSAKKSWDVRPSAPRAPKPQAEEPVVPVRARARVSGREARKTAVSTETRKRAPLKQRRREERKRFVYILWILVALAIGGLFYVLWLPTFRIHTITATGPNEDGTRDAAWQSITGTYAYVVPKNSIFFYPAKAVRANVLKSYPDIVAVSVHRAGLTTIAIDSLPRSSAFIWCGTSIDTPTTDGSCYDADAEGLVFATVPLGETASSSDLRIFAPLDRDVADGSSPVRAHVLAAARIPQALRFVKAVRGLGVPVSSLGIRDDEADLWLNGPTRVTYILGHEEAAAQLAAAAFPTLHLTDSSIQYVDLRFDGKVYIKRYGE